MYFFESSNNVGTENHVHEPYKHLCVTSSALIYRLDLESEHIGCNHIDVCTVSVHDCRCMNLFLFWFYGFLFVGIVELGE